MEPAAIDPAVIERARSGDAAAHVILYRALSPMIYTLARRMLRSPALAEDIVQESFVEIIRKAGQFRGEADIGLWARRIAINKCLSHLRSPWIDRRVSLDGDPAEASGVGPDLHPSRLNPLERQLGQRLELERALDTLSATSRAVVWLYVVEGYTHKEIGRLMGRTTSFSKTQLSRACAQLRSILEPEAEAHEAQALRETHEAPGQQEEIESCLSLLKTV